MSYYNVCSRCGAYLDPGEICDCSQETGGAMKQTERMRYQPKPGRVRKVKQYAG